MYQKEHALILRPSSRLPSFPVDFHQMEPYYSRCINISPLLLSLSFNGLSRSEFEMLPEGSGMCYPEPSKSQRTKSNEKAKQLDMAITGKQVRQLRSLAHHLNPALFVGKNGITSATIKQASDSLEAHELIKVALQDGCGLTVKEAGAQLADELDAELIQIIGHRIVLYRESSRDDIEKIKLA